MDGCSHRRARRSARRDPRELWPRRLPRCCWRGLAVSWLAAARAVAWLPNSETAVGTGWFTRIRPPSVRDVPADSGPHRRNVPAQTRNGFVRNPRSAISPALLLPARRGAPRRVDRRLVMARWIEPGAMRARDLAGEVGDGGDQRRPDLDRGVRAD